eukprot:gene416-493_t
MAQISTYCKSAYGSGGDPNQVYEQTQSYAKNALLNVAYHIQTIGTHLTTLLQLQAKEVDKIDIQVKCLTQRVEMIHETTGTNVFKAPESAKAYKSTLKERQVDSEDCKPPTRFVRRQVAYSMGSESSNNLLGQSGGGYMPPAAPAPGLSSSASSSQASTPSHASPPYTTTPPPVPNSKRASVVPPSLNMPPSIPNRPPSLHGSANLPPPSSPGNFLPPPPPPTAGFDLPPPPTMYDLPPPPPTAAPGKGVVPPRIPSIPARNVNVYDLPPPPPPM